MLFGALFFAQTASASFFMSDQPVIPDPLMVVTYQGGEENPIQDFISELFEKIDTNDTVQDNLKINRKAILQLLNRFVIGNSVAIVVAQPDLDFAYATLALSEEEYNELIATLESYEGLKVTTFEDQKIYSSYKRKAFAFTYDSENSVALVAEDAEIMETILSTRIAPEESLTEIYEQIPEDAFFSVVIRNNSATIDEDDTSTMLKGLASGLNYTFFALTQSSTDHFVGTSYAQGNAEAFTEADLDYTDYIFTPTLYQYLPGTNVFMYYEANNLYDFLQKTFVASGVDTSEVDLYGSLFGALLDDQLGILIQLDPENIIPYITLVMQVDPESGEDMAAVFQTNAFLDSAIEEGCSEEGAVCSTETPTCAEEESDGLSEITACMASAVSTFSMDLSDSLELSENTEAQLTLTYGLLDSAYYVISTNPTIRTDFGDSESTLNVNTTFANTMDTVLGTEDLLGLSYVDFAGVADYLGTVKSAFESEMETTEPIDAVIDFFETDIDSWYSYAVAVDPFTTQKTSAFHIPLSAAITYITTAIVEEMEQVVTAQVETVEFSDVETEDSWYAADVDELAEAEVVKGSNGEFRPADPVTRAEFITMVVRHYELEQEEAPLGSTIFSDVEEGSWYDQNIGIAYTVGLIKGDGEADTVRPNDPISRAEALQVLVNYSGVLYNADTDDVPFEDVSGDMWFSSAVEKGYAKGIITGVDATHFEPERSLTRAEAAVLINRVRSQELTLGF